MAFIQIQMANTIKGSLGQEFVLDSDVELNFTVVTNTTEVNTYYILEKGIEIFKLEYSGVIKYRGENLKKEVCKNHWRYNGFPVENFVIDFNWGVVLDGQVVSSVSQGGYFFDWISQMWRKKKIVPYSPWMRIDFDVDKVTPILAACVLFSYVAQVIDQ
jgi:hypothetical protein